MNDDDDWLDDSSHAGGRPGAPSDAASRDGLPAVPTAARERVIRGVYERLAVATALRDAPPDAAWDDGRHGTPASPFLRREGMPPPAESGVTLRSPPAGVSGAGEEERGAAPVAMNDVTQPCAPAAPDPPAAKAPAFLKSTEALNVPAEVWAKMDVLPFKPAPLDRPPPKRAPKTVQSPVVGLEPGSTAPIGDDSIEKAVAAVLPYVRSLPSLTLRQYASLCAELALRPERSGEILPCYQVHSDAARAALDAYWGRERAARPEAQAAFEEDYASYTAWLLAHRT